MDSSFKNVCSNVS